MTHKQVPTPWGYTCDEQVLSILKLINSTTDLTTECSCEGSTDKYGYVGISTRDNKIALRFASLLEASLPEIGGWSLELNLHPQRVLNRTLAISTIKLSWLPTMLKSVEESLSSAIKELE